MRRLMRRLMAEVDDEDEDVKFEDVDGIKKMRSEGRFWSS